MAAMCRNVHLIFCVSVLSFTNHCLFSYASFTDVTDKLLGGPQNGLVAAFGDFNSDKKTDVFVITDRGHRVELYLKDGNSSAILQKSPTAFIERLQDTITSIAPGDFDGDYQMDLLITTKPNTSPHNQSIPTMAYVYWGNVNEMNFGSETLVTDSLADQPLVMDSNADMIPDLFGADKHGQRKFWTTNGTGSRYFIEQTIVGREDYQLRIPNANAFADLDGNYAANLFVVSSKLGSQDTTFEVWSYLEENEGVQPWQLTRYYDPPPGVEIAHIGTSVFADMEADSMLDHILPICHNADCTESSIYVNYHSSNTNAWQLLFDLSAISYDDKRWGFVPPTTRVSDFTVLPLSVHVGDYNLDTHPDFLVLVQSAAGNGSYTRRVVLLQSNMGESGVILQPVWATDPSQDISSPILAAFLDVQRTGQLDIIIVNQTTGNSEPQMYLMDNMLLLDAYFVQVEVLSGICPSQCPSSPSGNIPYGVNQPGPMVRYDTTSSTGTTQKNGGAQLAQSAYFSLQLPYVLLGLGENPNFVDNLIVGVPALTEPGQKDPRTHTWTSIIPNSKLIVIPSPLNKPSDWISKIIIVPGQSVLLTGIVLISTCVLLALTAALLHLKERKDDEKEKRQEAHRFHFDAM